MKTKYELQKEIDKRELIGAETPNGQRDGKPYKKAQKEIPFYRDCLHYIESNPSEDFLKKEKLRLENKLALIKSGFDKWIKVTQKTTYGNTEPETYYNRIMEVSKFKGQLDVINFLLQ